MIAIIIEAAQKGNSERNHIKRILDLKEKEAIFYDKKNRRIIFYQMRGKGELLKCENYKGIIQKTKTLFFILDADEDYELTDRKIKELIETLEKSYEITADYFISCDFSIKKGNIESLLLSCVKDPLKKCYSEFLECLGKERLEKYSEKNILSKLFEIEDPPYDLDCKYLKRLKEKFNKFIEEYDKEQK